MTPRPNTCAQIRPPDEYPYVYIYKWRLQQEHHMKARNGGKGMTDDQIEACVPLLDLPANQAHAARVADLWTATYLDTSSSVTG